MSLIASNQEIKTNGDIQYSVSLPNIESSDSLKIRTADTYINKDIVINIHNYDENNTEYSSTDSDKNIIFDIDIPKDNLGTATAADVLTGQTFSSSEGIAIEGTLSPQYYYSGTTVPGATTGNNGDLFFKVVEG